MCLSSHAESFIHVEKKWVFLCFLTHILIYEDWFQTRQMTIQSVSMNHMQPTDFNGPPSSGKYSEVNHLFVS